MVAGKDGCMDIRATVEFVWVSFVRLKKRQKAENTTKTKKLCCDNFVFSVKATVC